MRLCCLAVFHGRPLRRWLSPFAPRARVRDRAFLPHRLLLRGAGGRRREGTRSIPRAYTAPGDTGVGLRKPRLLGPFPRGRLRVPRRPSSCFRARSWRSRPDFMRLRPLWFAFDLAVLVGAMLVTARRLGPRPGPRVAADPARGAVALPTSSLLQKGNVRGVIIAMSALAMGPLRAEARRGGRSAAGVRDRAASKLYPGPLVVPLLVRREWRALARTAGFWSRPPIRWRPWPTRDRPRTWRSSTTCRGCWEGSLPGVPQPVGHRDQLLDTGTGLSSRRSSSACPAWASARPS